MKVMQIVVDFPPFAHGGSEVHVFYLTHELNKLGIQCIVIHGGATKPPINDNIKTYNRSFDLNLFRLKRIFSISILGKFKAFMPSLPFVIMKEKPDIIHVHGYSFLYTIIGGLISYIFKIPSVLTIHGMQDYSIHSSSISRILPYIYDETLGRASLLLYNRLIAISSDVRTDIIKHGINTEKIELIPNGVDSDYYSKIPNYSLNKMEKKPFILCVGRLEERKGFQFMIRALPTIIKKIGSINLIIIGADAGYGDYLKKLVKELKLENYVRLLGYVSEDVKLQALHSAAIVVIPSIREPFGLIVLEAMAADRPVVATSAGGIVDIVKNNSAILVPPMDSIKLADAIIKILTNDDVKRTLIFNARKEVERFKWSFMAKRIINLYINTSQKFYNSRML